jgi:hypothetical protein
MRKAPDEPDPLPALTHPSEAPPVPAVVPAEYL